MQYSSRKLQKHLSPASDQTLKAFASYFLCGASTNQSHLCNKGDD